MKILLDMDSVCVDFLRPALKLFLKEDHMVENLITKWPTGEYSVSKMLNTTSDDFWSMVDRQGANFWRQLPEFDWFKDLYQKLMYISEGNVFFCTSPSFDPQSLAGKIQWMQDRFGRSFRNYVLTDKKFLLADKDSILVDDNVDKCTSFKIAGGSAVMFPAINNSNKQLMIDPVSYTLMEINKIIDGR